MMPDETKPADPFIISEVLAATGKKKGVLPFI